MTADDVVKRLRAEVVKAGSQTRASENLGVGLTYINDTLAGRKPPGKAILDALGLERVEVVTYRKKATANAQ